MARIDWRMASVFTARVCCGEPAAVHALVPKVLNDPEDPNAAARVQSVVVQVQNAAVPDQNVAVVARTVAAAAPTVAELAQSVVAVDLTAAEDHDAVAVHNAGAFPRAARALSGKVVAHNCAQVDPDVAREPRSAQGVQVAQIARGDPFPPVAGFFPDVPAVHFVQGDLFSRSAPDVPQGFRSPLPAVWWEQLTVVALAAPNR